MNIYLVCHYIDLGYHVHSVWTTQEEADLVCEVLRKEYLNSPYAASGVSAESKYAVEAMMTGELKPNDINLWT